MKKYDDHQSSSYDVESCSWSNLSEDDFIQHEDLPYCIGEFVWTGSDYLGEPDSPYYTDWPSHSSSLIWNYRFSRVAQRPLLSLS